MVSLDLVNIWRLQTLIQIDTHRGQASRIDYFLISFSLASKVSKCIIGDCLRSDYAMVTIQILTAEHPRGRGYWKFNLSLLNDSIFIEKTKVFVREFFETNENSSDPHNI